jgi:GT2 family glycosyltransferase
MTRAWTLTVLDDGPADPELARWFAEVSSAAAGRGQDVRYLHNPGNLGLNRNFQRCVDLADGDLVVLLGADDRMLPGYVRAVTAAAAAVPHAAMIQPGVRVIDAAGAPVRPLGDRVKSLLALSVHGRRVVGGEQLAASLLRADWMYFPAVAFRREWLRRFGFRPGYDVVLDLDMYLRMLLAGAELVLVEEVCFEYRRHAASLSSAEASSGGRFDEEHAFFAEARALMAAHGWRRAARAADAHLTSRLHALVRAGAAVRARDLGTARLLAAHAVRRDRRTGAPRSPA